MLLVYIYSSISFWSRFFFIAYFVVFTDILVQLSMMEKHIFIGFIFCNKTITFFTKISYDSGIDSVFIIRHPPVCIPFINQIITFDLKMWRNRSKVSVYIHINNHIVKVFSFVVIGFSLFSSCYFVL